MANDTTTRTWVIDTASAVAVATADYMLRIRQITWVYENALPGESAVVRDANDKEILTLTPAMAGRGHEIEATRGRFFNGLKVPTLSGGKLFIEIE